MERHNIERILYKYRKGEVLSPEERNILDNYYLHIAKRSQNKLSDKELQHNLSQIKSQIFQEVSGAKIKKIRKLWYSAAVAVAMLSVTSILIYINKKPATISYADQQRVHFESINAGTDKALLILENGEQFDLDNSNTIDLKQGHITIDGHPVNLIGKGKSTSAINTLQTPKGGQFKIVLSDGSQVWLNANSQLRYPTTFTNDSREVELLGEAYFEIKPNTKKPFRVRTKDQNIQVLGTGFNVSAYTEASTSTALAHGSVRVTPSADPKHMMTLLPGQQAISSAGKLAKQNADIESIMAWKNGVFKFKKTNLQDIVYQLERWYDIKFVFKNRNIPSRQITGEIQRKVNLSEIVEILSYFDISCHINGRTVYLDVKK